MADLRRLPPGTLPPVVLGMDASSQPVCLVTLKGQGLNETHLKDLAQFQVRNQIANVPGASVPQPFGGRYRQIMVYVDPVKLEAHNLSLMDVVHAVNDSNLILPAGDVRIGPKDYNIYANSQVPTPDEINDLPLKSVGNASVMVARYWQSRRLGHDSDEHRSHRWSAFGLYSGAEAGWRQQHHHDRERDESGDQGSGGHSSFAEDGGCLRPVALCQIRYQESDQRRRHRPGADGMMILVFLGSPRATFAVLLSIPLSALVCLLIMNAMGGSINTMLLGGLALAFSRLIDDSVVVLENIFRYMEMGEAPRVAAEKGGMEVSLAVLAATSTTSIVFFPVTFFAGVSQYLFTDLALGVVLSIFASYIFAMTVVPLYCAQFIHLR